MTWHYQIVRYADNKGFGLHEVFRDENGVLTGCTENPVTFACMNDEGPEEIIKALQMALKDAQQTTVIDDPV